MAAYTIHDDWASPEERELTHPSISALADAFIAARTPWPQTVARGTFFMFGPVSVFSRIGRTAIPIQDMLDELTRADILPHDASSTSTFATVVLPAWKRTYPEYANDWDIPLGAAMPSRRSRRENQLHAVATELQELQAGMGKLRREILALPGVAASNAYLDRPVWHKMIAFLEERATTAGPSCEPSEMGEFRLYSPSDDYELVTAGSAGEAGITRRMENLRLDAEPQHRVRAIYREMDGPRRFDASRRGGSYTRGIPPQDKRVTRPAAMTAQATRARTLWFREVYTLYVREFLGMSLRTAQLEFLAPFYADQTGSQMGSRARVALMRLSVDWAYERGPRAMLEQILSELLHPAVAYTHPMTTDEARCWILCALEHIYATAVATARVPVGVNEAAMDADRLVKQWARMYTATLAETVIDPQELASLMTLGGSRVGTYWLEGVRAEWNSLHGIDYIEEAAEAEVAAWLEQLQTAMTEANVVGDMETMPSMQAHLDAVAGIAWGRFYLATFHEDHAPTSADGSPVDIGHEIDWTTSIQYALRLTHLDVHIAQTKELEDFLGSVWLPLTATRASPALLHAMHAKLDTMHIDSESDAVRNGEDTRIREAGGVYIHPETVANVSEDGVVRYVFVAQRDVLARPTWHASFFERWAGRNTRELSSKLAYVARMDAYEVDAATHDLQKRGDTVIWSRAYSAEDMQRSWFASPVVQWPLYKEWTRMRMTWRAWASFGGGDDEIPVYDQTFEEHSRVMHPPEVRGYSILEALRGVCAGPVTDDVRVRLECTVWGMFVVARPASATETTFATRTCIFTVLKE